MIGLDTNVLVRYLAQDDPAQSATATVLIESLTADEPGYVTQVALVELIWVLVRLYAADREGIAEVVKRLLLTHALVVEQAEVVWQALASFEKSTAQFADCLIERNGHAAKCAYTVTFDRDAARTAGMRLLESAAGVRQ